MKIQKMANIVYRQIPAPRELPQQMPASPSPLPPGKSLDAKAPWWGQIFGANPRGCAGGWLWQKLIAA